MRMNWGDEDFDAEAELKKYENTETTVAYWNNAAPNVVMNSLRDAAKHLKENPATGSPVELFVHASPERIFSKDTEIAAILAAV
jgi:hypothetical protein